MRKAKQQKKPPTEFSCPDCAGVLKLSHESQGHRDYQCQVGHHFSTRSLLLAKEKQVEWSLWSAAALLEHIILIYGRFMEEEGANGLDRKSRRRLQQRVREAGRQKALLTRLIENTHAWE